MTDIQQKAANQAAYDERLKRLEDNVALKETDRVPFIYFSTFWAAKLQGYTLAEMMYDVDKYVAVSKQAIEMLQPDAFSSLLFAFGQTLEGLGYNPMKWPGSGKVNPMATFQYIDQEFMSPAEYDEYLFDPTGFYLHKYLPRLAKAYEPLAQFPDFAAYAEWDLIAAAAGLGNPALQEGLKRLFEVGNKTANTMGRILDYGNELMDNGYPMIVGGFCKAPYDLFADFLRGSKGGMMDMYRNKDRLLAAMAKARVLLLRHVKATTELLKCKFVFIPLHWGLDGFMSPAQFKTFYWPELRNVILSLIDMGLTPCVLWEGNCTTRLETIADVPAGKCVYWFEGTDMFKAKEVLRNTVCIRGNVPTSILITGTPEDTDEYCKKLIRVVGKGGGFMLDGAIGVPDEAKVENVIAMAQSVRKYAN